MFFGEFDDELRPGARNAVDVCLGIQSGERVGLIADEASRSVAAALESALAERGAVRDTLLVESVARRPMTDAPREILDVLENVDAGIRCASLTRVLSSPSSTSVDRDDARSRCE